MNICNTNVINPREKLPYVLMSGPGIVASELQKVQLSVLGKAFDKPVRDP
jgi:hypothetical protein